jgi:hypothetical protein
VAVHEVPLRSMTSLTSSIHIYLKKTLSYKNFELLLLFTGYHSLISHWLVTGTYENINLYVRVNLVARGWRTKESISQRLYAILVTLKSPVL